MLLKIEKAHLNRNIGYTKRPLVIITQTHKHVICYRSHAVTIINIYTSIYLYIAIFKHGFLQRIWKIIYRNFDRKLRFYLTLFYVFSWAIGTTLFIWKLMWHWNPFSTKRMPFNGFIFIIIALQNTVDDDHLNFWISKIQLQQSFKNGCRWFTNDNTLQFHLIFLCHGKFKILDEHPHARIEFIRVNSQSWSSCTHTNFADDFCCACKLISVWMWKCSILVAID